MSSSTSDLLSEPLVASVEVRVAFATSKLVPGGSEDDRPAGLAVGADLRIWDDPSTDWASYDRVVIRSTWDYTAHLERFLGWCRELGADRLRNAPDLIEFSSNKRYLADLSVPTVPTTVLEPGVPLPTLDGEVVVKPAVSAGARATGRFRDHAGAAALVAEIHASGGDALVQPYLESVDERGETSVVFIGGEISHVLHKRAVLRGEGRAPLAEGELAPAAVMFEPDLVTAGSADTPQLTLARVAHNEIAQRLGRPLYARIDLMNGEDGRPVLSELELIEPNLFLSTSPGASDRFAAAIRRS